mmetsp:Transcript_114438/g.180190  ORF Transcript_114438/g.180190 Transcript_114438/m.180190 type:complete len:293 (+) Transcript_114438:55-933(+)
MSQSHHLPGEVARLSREIEAKTSSDVNLQREVDSALQVVVDELTNAGHVVRQSMKEMAKDQVHLAKGSNMQEQMRKVLLRELAIAAALRELGPDIANKWGSTWGKEAEARLAISKTGGAYDVMVDAALRAFSSDQMVYVVCVNRYSQIGVDISLSLSTLVEEFSIKVSREATVAHVAQLVREERLRKHPAAPGKTVDVKLVGPGGTVLPLAQLIKHALDIEGADLLADEEGVFYPLSVLTGTKWRELGLSASTRWKHLHESEFAKLFGMSKATFEKLPDWKQIPMKRKHGLF